MAVTSWRYIGASEGMRNPGMTMTCTLVALSACDDTPWCRRSRAPRPTFPFLRTHLVVDGTAGYLWVRGTHSRRAGDDI